MKIRVMLIFLFMLFLALAGCKKEMIQSQKIIPIKIDGKIDEWRDYLLYSEKYNASFAIANDDTNLYVCFLTNDNRLQRQIMSSGFILWIDSKNHDQWGVKFPLGMMAPGKHPETKQNSMPPGFPPRQENMELMFGINLKSVELLDKKQKDIQHISITDAQQMGMNMIAALENGIFSYEIQIPLQENDTFSSAINSKEQFTLGFETPEIDMRSLEDLRQGLERRRGGRSGGMGRKHDEMSASPGGQSPGMNIDAVKIWLPILLAK